MSRSIRQCTFGLLWALVACGGLGCSAITADGPSSSTDGKEASTQPADKKFEMPPIVRAARAKKYDLLVKLVNDGADVNTQEYSGLTALWFAAKLGDVRSARFLLAKGADPNIAQHNLFSPDETPLMATHVVEIAHMLLDAKAAINAHDRGGWTALTFAVKRDDAEMIAYLIKRGADLNWKDSEGDTLLQLAKKWNHDDAVKALKEAGAKE